MCDHSTGICNTLGGAFISGASAMAWAVSKRATTKPQAMVLVRNSVSRVLIANVLGAVLVSRVNDAGVMLVMAMSFRFPRVLLGVN